ncbi:aromatic-L-amino-acid decarboxylase-like isoform X2 [Palaemon carinicauda]|uniref:aromatic-L-amino-acid decarboxylase-like isoform X2 n=1 Tax=Palaemon carinicauda TaxID=392227 RepID=UPI0035B5A11D
MKKSNEANEVLFKAINADGVTHLVPSKIKDVFFLRERRLRSRSRSSRRRRSSRSKSRRKSRSRFAVCSRFTESPDVEKAWQVIKRLN